MRLMQHFQNLVGLNASDWADLSVQEKLEKVDEVVGVDRYIAEEVQIVDHPFIDNGYYWRIYDKKFDRYGIGLSKNENHMRDIAENKN